MKKNKDKDKTFVFKEASRWMWKDCDKNILKFMRQMLKNKRKPCSLKKSKN